MMGDDLWLPQAIPRESWFGVPPCHVLNIYCCWTRYGFYSNHPQDTHTLHRQRQILYANLHAYCYTIKVKIITIYESSGCCSCHHCLLSLTRLSGYTQAHKDMLFTTKTPRCAGRSRVFANSGSYRSTRDRFWFREYVGFWPKCNWFNNYGAVNLYFFGVHCLLPCLVTQLYGSLA